LGVIPDIFNGGDEYYKAKNELARLCSSWELDEWNELGFERLKNIEIREILTKRVEVATTAQKAQCLQCSQFVKHVSRLSYPGTTSANNKSLPCVMTSGSSRKIFLNCAN
jgi:hypothetical protein